jgi:hypothetical protein
MFSLKKDHIVSEKNILYILNRLATSSIVDLYNAFIRILMNITSFEINDNYLNKKYFIKLLRKFYNNTKSKYLVNYLRNFGTNIKLTDFEKDLDNLKIYDYDFLNDYGKLNHLTKKNIQKYPNQLCMYIFYVKSLNSAINNPFNDNTLAFDIIENLKNLKFDNMSFHSSIYNLLKLTSIGTELNCVNFIVSHVYKNIPDLSNSVLNSKEILSLMPLPNKIGYFEENVAKKYLEEILNLDNKLIIPNFYYKMLFETEESFLEFLNKNNFTKELKLIAKSILYMLNGDYLKVIEIANELKISEVPSIKYYSREIYINSLLSTDIYKLTEVIVDSYLANPFSQLSLPISKVCNLVEDDIDKYGDWPDSIDVVILFHIYLKKRKLNKKSRLEFLYENFLIQNNCTTPLELLNKYKRNNHSLTKRDKYFFIEICIPNIMKKSIYFK